VSKALAPHLLAPSALLDALRELSPASEGTSSATVEGAATAGGGTGGGKGGAGEAAGGGGAGEEGAGSQNAHGGAIPLPALVGGVCGVGGGDREAWQLQTSVHVSRRMEELWVDAVPALAGKQVACCCRLVCLLMGWYILAFARNTFAN
jgi:hypothetical protein